MELRDFGAGINAKKLKAQAERGKREEDRSLDHPLEPQPPAC